MGICANSLWQHIYSTRFAISMGRARNRPHRAVQSTLRRLIKQAGRYADMERHVPELYDWHTNKDGVAPVMRCAILDVLGCPAAVLERRQYAMPACGAV